MAKDDVVIWTDVETIGVDYGDAVLEVASLVTNTKFELLDDEGYSAVVRYTPEEVEQLKSKTSDFVIDMHTKSGLWDRLPNGIEREVVDRELLDYVSQFAPRERQGRMAGNSIRLDLNTAQAYFPKFYNHIHYRFIDVTTLMTVANWNGVSLFQKEGKHEALADIKESLAEIRYIMEHTRYVP